MKDNELFKRTSEIIEMVENRIAEYHEFIDKYSINNDVFFETKLIDMGYSAEDTSSILINRDLLLSMFLNKFEVIEINTEDYVVEINVEIENVRKKYIDAVDNANKMIKAANEAKDMMLYMKQLIEEENGLNSNNWDNEKVHEMNEIISVYNDLVNKANSCVEQVKTARKELFEVRKKHSKQESINKLKNQNNIVLETS